MNVRLRFAPSPTGFLHIGSLRTVLFSYIIAKKLEGKFILRIEDTDQKREVGGAIENLIKILDWLDIKFDEGPHIGGNYGPYIQTQRLDLYKKYIEELLNKNGVYYCFCGEERLKQLKKEQIIKKQPSRYDRKCRNLSEEEIKNKLMAGAKYVIRQKMPLSGEVKVYDELRGEIKFKMEDLEDHVLIKSSGIPTYQFANVVDDHLMKTSHVTRSEEWIPSFPKNVLLYQLFGWEIPKFIHFPVVLNQEGGKLSKRQGDVAVEDYKNKGYLPEALINFCALMGWHPKDDNEILNLNQIIQAFEVHDMKTSSAIFDIEKLNYLNGYYIRNKPIADLVELCKPFMEKYYLEKESPFIFKNKVKDNKFIVNIIKLEQERLKKLSEIGETTEFFFNDNFYYDSDLLIWKKTDRKEIKKNLATILILIKDIPEENWNKTELEDKIVNYIKNNEKKVGNFLWPMRVSLTGKQASPGPFEVADVLGKKNTIRRIENAIEKLV